MPNPASLDCQFECAVYDRRRVVIAVFELMRYQHAVPASLFSSSETEFRKLPTPGGVCKTCPINHSIRDPQRELQDSRQIVLRGNLRSAGSRIELRVGVSELDPVKEVVKLAAKLDVDLSIAGDRELLHDRQIPVGHARSFQSWIVSRLIAPDIRRR